MPEVIRNRTIRPSSREVTSPYKIETQKVGVNDTLKVVIDHETTPDKWIYTFNGHDVAGKEHIYFTVKESEGNTIIQSLLSGKKSGEI